MNFRNKLSNHSKNFFIVLVVLFVLSTAAEIQVRENDPMMQQKKRIYCNMVSYHFLDNDMQTFNELAKQLDPLRIQVFKNKVARKLAENCQQKITIKQLNELAQMVQNPNPNDPLQNKSLYDLEHKYIEYFVPKQDIIEDLFKTVKFESERDIEREIKKFHEARKEIEENTKIVVDGFKYMQKHINQTGHQVINVLKDFYQAMHDITNNITQNINELKNSRTILEIKRIWDQL